MLNRLQQAVELGFFSDMDLYFSQFISELSSVPDDDVILAAALVSQGVAQGHVCIPLGEYAGKPVLIQGDVKIFAPALMSWCMTLRASGVVGQPGEMSPLILDNAGRLYLARYWYYEQVVADYLIRQASQQAVINHQRLETGLRRLFISTEPVNWQQIAAAIAVLKRFVVISGGPGTGKTTTVTKLLALLAEQDPLATPRIALAAPTGKAAARLTESIKQAKQGLDCAAPVLSAIPDQASTLHRLLGISQGRAECRYNALNPLPADVLVVDEASMIDLPMMARLVQALRPQCRLILLGDKDQLSSVEAGNVLGDICDSGHDHGYSSGLLATLDELTDARLASEPGPQMRDHVAVLRRSYRFGQGSGIGHLARAVNAGDGPAALALLQDEIYPDIRWSDVSRAQLPEYLHQAAVSGYREYLRAESPALALEMFNRFCLLCALREGPYGVVRVNHEIEQVLWSKGLIRARDRWYKGRPIMVIRNDYAVQLYNGDIGILWPDPEADGRLRAFFKSPDGNLRRILPQRLPEHETVYAMTVHKSQGSEFDRVVMVLPDEMSPALSRELLYTGITRARQQVDLWANRELLLSVIARRTERASGLRDALWSVM